MDLPKIRDLKDLQVLLDLMKNNDLAELEIEGEGRRIRLRKTEPKISAERVLSVAEAAGAPLPVSSPAPAAEESAAEPLSDLEAVNSPLVGTFYRAPSPEADPFVHEGDRVEVDSVLCIVEAMKVMNEIPAGVAGIVREILVKNGDPVEFGQPLFRIEAG